MPAGSNPSPDTPYHAPSDAWYARFARRWQLALARNPLLTKRQRIVAHAKHSLSYHGRMVYTETIERRELFHRKPGDFLAAHADCSQYSASLCHWVGVQGVTDTDWTGTLCKLGKWLEQPVPGCFVFFGVAPFVHMGVMIDRSHVIGFGDQQAPDESSLAGLLVYFAGRGHVGHSFRDLTV